MDHELLEQKGDFFAERDDTYSSIKHEFSRIFHENNLHSFANATDIGFLDMGKLGQGYSGDYEDLHGAGDIDVISGRAFPKEEVNPYIGMGMHNSYSPMRFLQPPLNNNVNYNTGFTNIANAVQKQQPMQESNLFQSYHQPYKYTDYSYLDYGTQPAASHFFPQNMYDIYNPPDMMDTHPNNPLSLMWSNDAPKSIHKKSFSADELIQSTQAAANLKKFTSVPPETIQVPKKPAGASLKIEQDFDKVSNKTIGQQLDKATKSQPDSAGLGPRRTNRLLSSYTTLVV